MRLLTAITLACPLLAIGQITVEVEAGGSTLQGQPAPYYDPMDVTIHVGDAVHWTTASGTHNVYGMHDMFPDNPEEFSSGEPTSDLDYTHTFTIPGFYGYHCTQQGHSLTQHGTITVLLNESVQEHTLLGQLVMFPVPAAGRLTVQLDGSRLQRAEVLSIDGRSMVTHNMTAGTVNTIDLDGIASGRYLLRLMDTQGQMLVRPFVKE